MEKELVEILREGLEKAIEEKNYKKLKELLSEQNSVDIAEALDDFDEKDVLVIFRLLSKETAADAFSEMDSDMQEKLLGFFTDKEIKTLLDELYADDTVDILEEMPASVVARVIRNADAETRKSINSLLMYHDASAGSIMTTEYVSLKKEMTVSEAFDRIRREGIDKETVYNCYVTENRKLIGVVSVRAMLISDKEATIESIMHTNFISVYTSDDKEYVAEQIRKYGFLAIPVTDTEGRLVGIVTIDDAMDVMQDENTEDMQIMAAISPSDQPYLKTGVFKTWLQRVPWLMLLMISATFTSKIILSFESALAACAVLTAFVPMLMDTGGNAGSQASVTVIRGLSLGEISIKDFLKVAFKELRVAFLCGLSLAPVAFLKAMYVDGMYAEPNGIMISLVVGLTMLFTVCVAKVIGCLLPILAKLLHLDPAVVASPFITTVVDALSLMLYFTLSSKILGL